MLLLLFHYLQFWSKGRLCMVTSLGKEF
ncbi:unnamed protein product [Linum tenue]|uniref:Uncharacterized protein n=1 Tax=Linum tenue TaxID=586396 RepID=A0AAV0N8R2_9ROSI|nr:unnamed protein product [Linum tenue]